jgi:hypothetical protein
VNLTTFPIDKRGPRVRASPGASDSSDRHKFDLDAAYPAAQGPRRWAVGHVRWRYVIEHGQLYRFTIGIGVIWATVIVLLNLLTRFFPDAS